MLQRLVDKITCNHFHNADSHPACFAVGNVNHEKAQSVLEEYGKPWYQVEGLKVGIIDIEADGLKSDFSTMLSWSIKEKNGPTVHDVVTKAELFAGEGDKRIVQSCIDEMNKYKILIGYYSTGYDIPFIRTKALHHGLLFPGYVNEDYEKADGTISSRGFPEIYHFDMYYVVKSKLCLSRKSLDNACDYLHIKGKTPLDKDVWRRAKYGDPQALQLVVEHNIADCEILDELHEKLAPFAKFTRKSI
jgi:uncharacterized protein YprB with RNaseH-like and TPR domain